MSFFGFPEERVDEVIESEVVRSQVEVVHAVRNFYNKYSCVNGRDLRDFLDQIEWEIKHGKFDRDRAPVLFQENSQGVQGPRES